MTENGETFARYCGIKPTDVNGEILVKYSGKTALVILVF